jgi:hypothetical protein
MTLQYNVYKKYIYIIFYHLCYRILHLLVANVKEHKTHMEKVRSELEENAQEETPGSG